MEKIIKIAHISDLHLSEKIFSETPIIKGLYGHSYSVFKKLTEALNKMEFDLLLISGDISKSGTKDSFSLAKTWLEKEISISRDEYIGLNLIEKKIPYLIVPGNHDYYDRGFIQKTKDEYLDFFDFVDMNKIKTMNINSVNVNVHMYDSCKRKSIALGELRHSHKTKRDIKDDNLDIAMLHHHIAMPPNLKRDKTIEIENIREDASYLLSVGFNSILFGHTHSYFQDCISQEILIRNFPIKRGRNRFYKKVLRRIFDNETNSVNYLREKSQNGQYPDFNSYMEYLYLKDILKIDVKSPKDFESIKAFYAELERIKEGLDETSIEILLNKKLHLSMAESACQEGCKSNGFNYFIYNFSERTLEYTKVAITEDGYKKMRSKKTPF